MQIPCLSDYLHVLEASEDDGEDGGNDADQVDQVHLVREELALVRADQQPQEVPGTDFWKTFRLFNLSTYHLSNIIRVLE